jgi:translin
MKGLEEETEKVRLALSDLENETERTYQESREIVRKTKTAMHLIHVGRRNPELIDSISGDLAQLVESLREHPQLIFGTYVQTAMAEFAETVIYDRALRREEIPGYGLLDITPSSWAMGLADSIGELRRDMVQCLAEGKIDGARKIFASMEELCEALMSLDVKDSVAPVRRKQDIARQLVERSRSELATAAVMSRGTEHRTVL